MENKITLYRWISTKNINLELDYINLTNSLDFAKWYGDIVLVYSWEDENILEEDIFQRADDVRSYDQKIDQKNISGYKWKISNTWIYHYRVKTNLLKLQKIIYTATSSKETISSLTRFNRKYLRLNQTEFSQKIWIPRVKVSEYENAQREPSLEKISLLSSLVDIEQEIQVWSRRVLLSS